MGAPPPSYADKAPNLLGGTLAVDLINTVGWRGRLGAARQERLSSYGELVHWARHAGALAAGEVAGLLAAARRDPAAAAQALERALALREALARLFASRTVRRADLEVVNALLSEAPPRTRLVAGPGQLRWSEERPHGARRARVAALMRPLWPVVWDATALLSSPRRAQVRGCGDRECGWMFLDASRGHTRRWCSMEDCGNRAKARRHYLRTRQGPAGSRRG
jgi:predicted RNA-binding Zn ribbon-like protein